MQISLENVFVERAENESYEKKKPAIVLCDRGLYDGSAFVAPELWSQIVDEQQLGGLNFIEKRYDAIVHMVTAAEGAEKFYDYSNEARYETAEEARASDKKLRQAYLGHHRYMIVGNTGDFEDKMSTAINYISSQVGLPTDVQIFKKYLVCPNTLDVSENHKNLKFPEDIHTETIIIKETYLKRQKNDDENSSVCVRSRQRNGLTIFNYEKRLTRDGQRIQEMRTISAQEYLQLKQDMDKDSMPLVKTRTLFGYNTLHFQLETYTNIPGSPTLLKVETNND